MSDYIHSEIILLKRNREVLRLSVLQGRTLHRLVLKKRSLCFCSARTRSQLDGIMHATRFV